MKTESSYTETPDCPSPRKLINGKCVCPPPRKWNGKDCKCPDGWEEDMDPKSPTYRECYDPDPIIIRCPDGWERNAMGQCVDKSIYTTWYTEDPVYGCMDNGDHPHMFEADGLFDEGRPPGYVGAATNYNEAATFHQGPCYYEDDPVYGCTDGGPPYPGGPGMAPPAVRPPGRPPGFMGAALNWHPWATIDDGSCLYEGGELPEGCMDHGHWAHPWDQIPERPDWAVGAADNYDPQAMIHDGSCTYSRNYITNGGVIAGCMDNGNFPEGFFPDRPDWLEVGVAAENYNELATVPDPDNPCEYPDKDGEIYGCMDPRSGNYNKHATIDNGSCDPPCIIQEDEFGGWEVTFEGGEAPDFVNEDDDEEEEEQTGDPIYYPIIPIYPPPEEITLPEEISCDEECDKDDLTY